MSGIEGGDVTMGPGPGKYTFKDYMNEEVGTEKLVDTAVSFSEYASDKPEFYRALIRACLRKLPKERAALQWAVDESERDGVRFLPPKTTERLRSLLPETEGEA